MIECNKCGGEVDPDEGFHCLDCGENHTEDVMAAAYDYAKDLRKYGVQDWNDYQEDQE